MAYSNDDDLQLLTQGLASLGIDDFSLFHKEAEKIVNFDLQNSWFVEVCSFHSRTVVDFDPLKIKDGKKTLRGLAALKVLENVYRACIKPIKDDPFLALSMLFKTRYSTEFWRLVRSGITYDFSGDGNFNVLETLVPIKPRMVNTEICSSLDDRNEFA